MKDILKIAPFFSGWEETFIWSYLQGHMGYAISDNDENPSAAQIVVGDVCFFAGVPNDLLIKQAAAPIIVSQNEKWNSQIEFIWGERVKKAERYAIKKEPGIFNTDKLVKYTESLESAYTLRMIDEKIYECVMKEDWSKDLCSQFEDYNDYHNRGIGVVALYQGTPVSGASSYVVYNGGIEIEIDTKPEFRRKGLATACGAKLILECLKKGLYPSWDAYDLRSVSLAEKLGYHMDHPYTVYIKNDSM